MGIPKERHTSDDSKPTTINEKKKQKKYMKVGGMVKEYKKSWMDLAKAKDINVYNFQ